MAEGVIRIGWVVVELFCIVLTLMSAIFIFFNVALASRMGLQTYDLQTCVSKQLVWLLGFASLHKEQDFLINSLPLQG